MTDKPLFWVYPLVRKAMQAMPTATKQAFGFALYMAQRGLAARGAKAMKGFKGAAVMQVRDDADGSTYRVAYAPMSACVVVLHAWQKKSKSGDETSKADVDLIKKRYADAAILNAEVEDTESAKEGINQRPTADIIRRRLRLRGEG
jgi:phage-related protein